MANQSDFLARIARRAAKQEAKKAAADKKRLQAGLKELETRKNPVEDVASLIREQQAARTSAERGKVMSRSGALNVRPEVRNVPDVDRVGQARPLKQEGPSPLQIKNAAKEEKSIANQVKQILNPKQSDGVRSASAFKADVEQRSILAKRRTDAISAFTQKGFNPEVEVSAHRAARAMSAGTSPENFSKLLNEYRALHTRQFGAHKTAAKLNHQAGKIDSLISKLQDQAVAGEIGDLTQDSFAAGRYAGEGISGKIKSAQKGVAGFVYKHTNPDRYKEIIEKSMNAAVSPSAKGITAAEKIKRSILSDNPRALRHAKEVFHKNVQAAIPSLTRQALTGSANIAKKGAKAAFKGAANVAGAAIPAAYNAANASAKYLTKASIPQLAVGAGILGAGFFMIDQALLRKPTEDLKAIGGTIKNFYRAGEERPYGTREFQQSTQGLVFGLHNRRTA